MTQQETAQVLTLLRAAYPAFYKKTTAQEAEIAGRLWAEMFSEDDYGIVQYALNTVYHGQFLKQIPTIEARMTYEASLPAPVKAAISAATKRMPDPRRQLTEREVNDRRNQI